MSRQWSRGLLAFGLGASLFASGCKKQPVATNTPGAQAAAANADVAGAEALVRGIYKPYAIKDGPIPSLGDPAYYSSFIVEQEKAYEKREVEYDGVGAIDGDPICQCQDYEGLTLTSLAMVPTGPGTMDAKAVIKDFKDSPDLTPLTLKLVKTPAGWRIDDVVPADPSQGLRALYARDIEEDKKLEKPKHK